MAGGEGKAQQGRGASHAIRQRSYHTFRDLLDSGEFRSLVVRTDPFGVRTFTLKAVLTVQSAAVGVYMHGQVSEEEVLIRLLDELLRNAEWRIDRFYRG